MTGTSRLSNYVVSNFGTVFFPVFISLYAISSILIFLQISAKTSFIKMTLFDMLELYFYAIPEMAFYLLPVSFFASSVIAFAKMSFDLELIVLFSLQSNVRDILKPIMYLSIVLSVVLILIGFVIKPISNYKTKEFITSKESTAEVNIKPSEFGQKFGDWLLFVKEKGEGKDYKDIVLLSTKKNEEMFIRADKATFNNNEGKFNLDLEVGQSYRFIDDSIEEIKFKNMVVNEQINQRSMAFQGVIDFWMKLYHHKVLEKDVYYTLLTALFPVMSTLLVAALGIYNPRYEKNRSIMFVIATITIFFVLTNILGDKIRIFSLLAVPTLWMGASYLLYVSRVRRYY